MTNRNMKARMETYCYLVERKSDNKKFAMYGNLRNRAIGISDLFRIVEDHDYCYESDSPFGAVSVYAEQEYNPKYHRVLKQVAVAM